MSPAVNLRSLQVLNDLRAALVRYSHDALQSLADAAMEIQRTLAWLAERVAWWQAEVRRLQEVVRRAREALQRCRSSSSKDKSGKSRQPDCGQYERALQEAERLLREAELQLRTALMWQQRVQQSADAYQRDARGLADRIHNDLPKATATLSRSADILQGYVTMNAPAVSAPPPASALPYVAAGIGAIGIGAIDIAATTVKLINSKYSGSVFHLADTNLKSEYPDGVAFTSDGYPDFAPYAIRIVRISMTGDRQTDYAAANSAAGLDVTPEGFTWHHHQDRTTMQLIPTDIHYAVRHSGGVSLINQIGPITK